MDTKLFQTEKMEAEVPVEEYVRECVDVDKFLGFCRECKNYEKRWSCPPFAFDPLDIWHTYDRLRILGVKIYLPKELRRQKFSPKQQADLMQSIVMEQKKKFDEEMLALEKATEGSLSLSGGSCLLCEPEDCTKVEGKPCRHPECMRHSIEALGGDVGKTVEKYLNQKLLWIKDGTLPEYFILVGGLLIK